jgi:hypothetical protein
LRISMSENDAGGLFQHPASPLNTRRKVYVFPD